MITSIVGRLIKRPELVEQVSIPGKRVVKFTLVDHSTRGGRRLSVFYNLSLVVGTDAMYQLVMRFEKGTVLAFSFPRITYVRQSDKDAPEPSINIYAEADNFQIVSGGDLAPAGNPSAPGTSRAASAVDPFLTDPFASEPFATDSSDTVRGEAPGGAAPRDDTAAEGASAPEPAPARAARGAGARTRGTASPATGPPVATAGKARPGPRRVGAPGEVDPFAEPTGRVADEDDPFEQ